MREPFGAQRETWPGGDRPPVRLDLTGDTHSAGLFPKQATPDHFNPAAGHSRVDRLRGAFWDGAQVCWPQASALRGSTERLLMDGLTELGQVQTQVEVHLPALARFNGAVAFNASGIWPLAAIGEQRLEQSDVLLVRLQSALAQTPWLPL